MKALFQRDLNFVWLQNILLLAALTISSALLPLYIQQAGHGEGTNGFILGMSLLGSLVALISMGAAIDRHDPRVFIALGAMFWAVTSISISVSNAVWVLVPARFLQGFGYVIYYTASVVYASRSVPDEVRGAMVGMIEAIGAFSIGITPALAYWLQARWGYQPVFWLAAVFAAVTSASVVVLAPRPLIHPGERPADKGLGLLSRRALMPGLVAASLFCAAEAFVNLSPLVAQHVHVNNIGLYLGIRALATVPTRLFSGFAADRKGPAWVIIPGLTLAALGMTLVPLAVQPGWVFLAPLLFGMGMGLASPALTAWMLKGVGAHERAAAVNTFTLLCESTGFLGVWGLGLALQTGGLDVFYGITAILLTGLLAYLGMMLQFKKSLSLESGEDG